MSKLTPCVSIYGNIVEIPIEKLRIRVAAYGILKENAKILLVKDKWAHKWELPGGGIKMDENLEDAVIREFKEETGLTAKVLKFLTYKEGYLYQDDKDLAWKTFRFYFEVEKISGEIIISGNKKDVEKVGYVNIKEIKKEEVKTDVYEVLTENLSKAAFKIKTKNSEKLRPSAW